MYSHHAEVRCQQRGISKEIVDVLLSYGARRHRHGAEVCFMDRAARRQAAACLGRERFARIADRLNSYVVLADDGAIVTAAPRLNRMKF
jgi:uncharacterized protein (DUF2252 family)